MRNSFLFNKKNNFSLFKVIVPGVLLLIVFFSLFLISNNKSVIDTLARLVYGDNEVELDNWEISTVFYDSTVNDGKTPLTEINWDVESTDYTLDYTRVITVQINYKNANTINTYEPGDIKIKIPNIAYKMSNYNKNNSGDGRLTLREVNVSANDINHEGYDWDYSYKDTNTPKVETIGVGQNYLFFKNAISFEKGTNFEGAIQIVYTLESHHEDTWYLTSSEAVSDECEENFNYNVKAQLLRNNVVLTEDSRSLIFSYYRKYIHLWNKKPIELIKTASKLENVDNLNLEDGYYWVKYIFEHKNSYDSNANNSSASSYFYPRQGVYYKDIEVIDSIPEECIVYNVDGELLSPEENGKYYFNADNSFDNIRKEGFKVFSVIVGYPKSIYNSENNNLTVTNTASEYGKYAKENDFTYFGDSSVSINLSDYDLSFDGDLYSLLKKNSSGNNTNHPYSMYYQSILSERSYNSIKWSLTVSAVYTGKPMTVLVGDDLLYYTNLNGDLEKLNDDDYYYTMVDPPLLTNANMQRITNTYEYELWVRKAGNNDYELYKNGEIGYYSEKIDFTKDEHIVGWYYLIKDLHESLIPGVVHPTYQKFDTNIVFLNKNILETGEVYNSGYLQVYNKNKDGGLVLANPVDENSYYDFLADKNIDNYDYDTYGRYLERSYAIDGWKYYNEKTITNRMKSFSKISNAIQDENRQVFKGTYTIFGAPLHNDNVRKPEFEDFYELYLDDEINYIYGFTFNTVLPDGMYIDSSLDVLYDNIYAAYYSDNSKNIITTDSSNTLVYDSTGKKLSIQEVKDLLVENTKIVVDYNYEQTGKNKVTVDVDLNNNPLIYVHGANGSSLDTCGQSYGIALDIPYYIPYDSLIDYGSVWTNTTTSSFLHENVNHNNVASSSTSLVINNIIGVHEDLSTMVQSKTGSFDVGKVETSLSNEYVYKLRVRTGNNEVTNLVIYDSLEKYAKDSNMEFINASSGYNSWQGTFLGVDTSYAESKGYNVKVYYSEKVDPGNLKNDDSWKLYTDSVDKSKVKSLAFEYLDNEGNPAVLPMNSLTYVLIKMKSPADENLKTLAYNGCWTEWNAIDSVTGSVVDFVTGINSNIVKVGLPNSVEPVDIDLEINKYWVDANNKLGKRPQSINVQLVPDDDITKAIDVPLSIANVVSGNSKRWKTTISVPKYDIDGNEISYSVREDEIVLEDGYKYTPSIDNNNVTNSLMKEIELKKIWKDNNNNYLTRPTNVIFIVKQNGNDYKEVTVTGDYSTNEWIKKLTVPVYDSSNREYTYTLEEVNVDGYGSNCEDFVCTNTLSGNKNITITKEWNDKNNEYSTRPDSVNIKIKQNGNDYKTITVTGNGNIWNYNITEVPIYDDNGVKYNYTILEDNVDEYGLVEYDQNNYKITNTLKKKINLAIKKIWVDDNNSNNTRPDELTITLLRDGVEYQTVTLSGDTNEWITTVEVDKYDNNLNKYKYSIQEVNDSIKDEYSDVTYSEDELTVTNTLSQNTSLTITKKWIDQDNKYLTRPDSVSINLLQNGNLFRELNVIKDNNWKMVVNNVPMYDSNGVKYNYTIVENNVDTKYGNITYDQTNLEVTNELTEEPKVTLYFTVVNGYVDSVTGEMKYDDFGFSEVLKKHNLDPEKEYTFKFLLENTDTNKKYEGKLSTHGILEFKDIPYGTYKAVESDDIVFEFFDMMSIENVNGVTFKKEGKTGYITINPTGEDIIYGAKIINKIKALISNPKTIKNLVYVVACLLISYFVLFLFYKNIIFYKR